MHFKTVLAHLKWHFRWAKTVLKCISTMRLADIFSHWNLLNSNIRSGSTLAKDWISPYRSLIKFQWNTSDRCKKTPQLHEVTLNPTIYKSNSSKNTPAVNVNETPIILIICVQKLSLQNHLFCTKVTWWKKDQMIKMTSFWSKT